MKLIDEVTNLVNQLDSVVEDSKSEFGTSGIYEISIDSRGSKVNLCWLDFLQGFKDYDVMLRRDFINPYKLTIEHKGVEFVTKISNSEMQIIERDYPVDYEYISTQALL